MTRPIPDVATIMQFNEDELLAGLMDYRKDDPEPGANRSDAFWWGWWCRRNPRPDDADPRAVAIYWAMRAVSKHMRET